MDSDALPCVTLKLIDAVTIVQCSESPVLTLTTVMSSSDGDTTAVDDMDNATLDIYVARLQDALRLEQIMLNSKFSREEIYCPMSYQVGICSDQLVWQQYENDALNETVDSNKIVNENNSSLAIMNENNYDSSISLKNIHLVAVDAKNLLIQLNWMQYGGDKNICDASGDSLSSVGGSAQFSTDGDLFKFLHTLQSCSDLDIIKINSKIF